jgi:lysophospholipase L1-like esterase
VAFLGDSLTEGVGAPPEQGFAWRLASKLGWEAATVDGVSGSGYLASGAGRPLPERVWGIVRVDPDVVVVSGGNNDAFQGFAPQDVRPAAEQTFRALAAGLPDARIVVLGPFPTSPAALSSPDAMNQAVRAAAKAVGVEYVDARQVVDDVPLSMVGDYLSADGLHPNEAGHEAIATELAEILGGG